MPSLQICNSQLTDKAGEWALLFYARDQGATKLEDIEELDLNGKGIIYMKDISLWDRMTNLKRLNICENMEFFMNKEIKAAYDKQLLQGIDA